MRKTPILLALLLVGAWAGKILSDSTKPTAAPTPTPAAVQTQNSQAQSANTKPPAAIEPIVAHPMQ